MRQSLRRIAVQKNRRISQNCIRCDGSQGIRLRPRQPVPSLQQRFYSDDNARDPSPKKEDAGVESTGTVPDDPDIIATESPSVQQPPASPAPPHSSSPQIPPQTSPSPASSAWKREPWHFRLPETQRDSAAKARQLRRMMTTTSLRRNVHWFAPVEGVNPAYDMALMFLKHDQRQKIAAIQKLEQRIAKERKDGGSVEYISQLENARYKLLILRDINMPEIRWRYKQGDIDLRLPAHQYLYSQNWMSGVYVGKIMQRLETMKIVPDSLPTLTPKVDFRLRWNQRQIPSRVRVRKWDWRDMEAGELVESKILMNPPRMEIIPHYREWWEKRKYTIVMLDLDVPDVESDTFKTKLHWMVKDVVASPVESIIQEGNGETVVPYLPPHPFRGMKYHRYPIFVFEQPSDEWLATRTQIHSQHKQQQLQSKPSTPTTTSPATTATTATATDPSLSPLLAMSNATPGPSGLRTYATDSKSKYAWSNLNRDTFSIRGWANQMGMKPVGAHLVRCQWDENVPNIMQLFGIKERAFKKIKSQETSPFDF